MWFISAKAKLNFQQSSVSHKLLDIILLCWFAAQEILNVIINAELNMFLLNIMETTLHFVIHLKEFFWEI